MDREDLHRLVVGLGQQRLVHPGSVGALQFGPSDEGAEIAAVGLLERSGLVDEEAQPPPHLGRSRIAERQQEGVPLAEQPLEQRGRREPPPVLPQRAQVLERLSHGVLGGNRLGHLAAEVPPTARAAKGEQVDVRARVQRGAQGGDEAQLIAGVVDRAHRGDRVAHLLCVVHERARRESIGDVLELEGLAQVGQRRARGHEDRHVRQARGPPLGRPPVVHRPAVWARTDVGDRAGHVGRFGLAQRTRLHLRVRMRATEQDGPVVDAEIRLAPAGQRLVLRLRIRLLNGHRIAEERVDPREDRLDRAEVGGEPGPRVVRTEPVAGSKEQFDVGASEPVDRLFRVADEEQAAVANRELGPRRRRVALHRRRDQDRELDLNGVGVLELVEEDVGVALVQAIARVAARAQQISREHEEVVELEPAVRASGLGGVEDLAAHQDEQVAQHLVGQGRHDLVDRGVDRVDARLGALHVAAPGLLLASAAPSPVLERGEASQLAVGIVDVANAGHLGNEPLGEAPAEEVARVAARRRATNRRRRRRRRRRGEIGRAQPAVARRRRARRDGPSCR